MNVKVTSWPLIKRRRRRTERQGDFMASHQEEEAAGPSGIAHHEVLQLLGL